MRLEVSYLDGEPERLSKQLFRLEGTLLEKALEGGKPFHVPDMDEPRQGNPQYQFLRSLVERGLQDAIFLPLTPQTLTPIPAVVVFATRTRGCYDEAHLRLSRQHRPADHPQLRAHGAPGRAWAPRRHRRVRIRNRPRAAHSPDDADPGGGLLRPPRAGRKGRQARGARAPGIGPDEAPAGGNPALRKAGRSRTSARVEVRAASAIHRRPPRSWPSPAGNPSSWKADTAARIMADRDRLTQSAAQPDSKRL